MFNTLKINGLDESSMITDFSYLFLLFSSEDIAAERGAITNNENLPLRIHFCQPLLLKSLGNKRKNSGRGAKGNFGF